MHIEYLIKILFSIPIFILKNKLMCWISKFDFLSCYTFICNIVQFFNDSFRYNYNGKTVLNPHNNLLWRVRLLQPIPPPFIILIQECLCYAVFTNGLDLVVLLEVYNIGGEMVTMQNIHANGGPGDCVKRVQTWGLRISYILGADKPPPPCPQRKSPTPR